MLLLPTYSPYGALMMPGYQLHEGLGIEIPGNNTLPHSGIEIPGNNTLPHSGIEIPGNNIGRAYGTLFALGGEPWELAIDK